jgi:hypothetical protein
MTPYFLGYIINNGERKLSIDFSLLGRERIDDIKRKIREIKPHYKINIGLFEDKEICLSVTGTNEQIPIINSNALSYNDIKKYVNLVTKPFYIINHEINKIIKNSRFPSECISTEKIDGKNSYSLSSRSERELIINEIISNEIHDEVCLLEDRRTINIPSEEEINSTVFIYGKSKIKECLGIFFPSSDGKNMFEKAYNEIIASEVIESLRNSLQYAHDEMGKGISSWAYFTISRTLAGSTPPPQTLRSALSW